MYIMYTHQYFQNITLANTFDIQQSDGKLYMFLGASGKSPLVSVYDEIGRAHV